MTHPAKFPDLLLIGKILNKAQNHKANNKIQHTHTLFFSFPFNDFLALAGAKHAVQKSGRAKALAPATLCLLLTWAVARLSHNPPRGDGGLIPGHL